MSGAPLWMQLHIPDYIRDTRHLSTVEHGAYLLLMMSAWTSAGDLPADEKRLARISGLNPKEWNRSREILLDFFTLEGGFYRQKRIDLELQKAGELIEQKRAAGKASARARAQQALNSRSTGVATGTSTGRQREANQSQSQGSVSNDTGGTPPEDPLKKLIDDGIALLLRTGTKSEGSARSLIGMWRRDYGNDATHSMIADAVQRNVADPKGYITKGLASGSSQTDALFASINRSFGGNPLPKSTSSAPQALRT